MRLTKEQQEALKEMEGKESNVMESALLAMLDKMESPKPNDDFKRFLKMFADFAVSMQKVALNKPEVEIEVDAESIKKAIDQNTLAIRKNTEALQRQNEILMKEKTVTYDFEGKITKVSVK
jgi:flagellar biosynthesis/type III secretory pathway chaperone